MKSFIVVAIVVSSVFLSIAILLQNRSGGLGTVFGGSSGGEGYRSKRGLEKFLYYSSIILAVVFGLLCLFYFVLPE